MENFRIWDCTRSQRALEGDKGKNTGGMGAYSPSRLENNDLNEKIIKIID